jgi:hypothetical protein
MGGEEALWKEAYERQFCYDCLNFECERDFDATVACQWRKCLKTIEGCLKNDNDISD